MADVEWIHNCRVYLDKGGSKLLKNPNLLLDYFLECPNPNNRLPERAYKGDSEPLVHPRRQQIRKFVRATEHNLGQTTEGDEALGVKLAEPGVWEHLCLVSTLMREPYTKWHMETMVKHVCTFSERLTQK